MNGLAARSLLPGHMPHVCQEQAEDRRASEEKPPVSKVYLEEIPGTPTALTAKSLGCLRMFLYAPFDPTVADPSYPDTSHASNPGMADWLGGQVGRINTSLRGLLLAQRRTPRLGCRT